MNLLLGSTEYSTCTMMKITLLIKVTQILEIVFSSIKTYTLATNPFLRITINLMPTNTKNRKHWHESVAWLTKKFTKNRFCHFSLNMFSMEFEKKWSTFLHRAAITTITTTKNSRIFNFHRGFFFHYKYKCFLFTLLSTCTAATVSQLISRSLLQL